MSQQPPTLFSLKRVRIHVASLSPHDDHTGDSRSYCLIYYNGGRISVSSASGYAILDWQSPVLFYQFIDCVRDFLWWYRWVIIRWVNTYGLLGQSFSKCGPRSAASASPKNVTNTNSKTPTKIFWVRYSGSGTSSLFCHGPPVDSRRCWDVSRTTSLTLETTFICNDTTDDQGNPARNLLHIFTR